jgi:hypothetical protein
MTLAGSVQASATPDKRGLDESASAFHISVFRATAPALKWPKSAPFVTIRRPGIA